MRGRYLCCGEWLAVILPDLSIEFEMKTFFECFMAYFVLAFNAIDRNVRVGELWLGARVKGEPNI